MKRNEIINTVDFDYPSCGGIIVTRGRKNYTCEKLSNYKRLDMIIFLDIFTEFSRM